MMESKFQGRIRHKSDEDMDVDVGKQNARLLSAVGRFVENR